jgi:DNA-binding SARP family transcriptional activator
LDVCLSVFCALPFDRLWPDLTTKAASNNLRQVLCGARKVLDPASGSYKGYLSLKDEQLILCPEGQLWVDVDAFEAAAATARRAKDPATYRAAVDLYGGELLPEDRYEGWTEGRRQGLAQLQLALLVELAGLYEERGEYERGIEALQRVLSEEPTREEVHASLMRLYALAGQRRESLLQYERLKKSLSQRLHAKPNTESKRLYEEIRAGSTLSIHVPSSGGPSEEIVDSTRNNIPSSLTSFVGREREIVEAKRLLAMTRLLTLTGAGGSGKTRLALEMARDLVRAYPDGVWLVELAPLSEPDLVPQAVAVAVAKAIEVRERPGQPLLESLVDALHDSQMLLVFDSCEHLVDAVARTSEALLRSCPRLKVLATSREPLGVRGEVLWQVRPLSLPDATHSGPEGEATVEGLMRYEAIRLFVDLGFALRPACGFPCIRVRLLRRLHRLDPPWLGPARIAPTTRGAGPSQCPIQSCPTLQQLLLLHRSQPCPPTQEALPLSSRQGPIPTECPRRHPSQRPPGESQTRTPRQTRGRNPLRIPRNRPARGRWSSSNF